jgi:AraC-like DNA-binding protein
VADHLFLQHVRRPGIQPAQGLIQDPDRGVVNQGSHHQQLLLHAPGIAPHLVPDGILQLKQVQVFFDVLLPPGGVNPIDIRHEIQVFHTRQPIIQVISDLIKEMTENPGRSYDFKKIAAQHKISYYHFRRCFIQYTQIPIHEFLLQKRFALAIHLLKNGQDSVKEIADRCGFRTSSDFSRFVKERSGTTPSELRQQSKFTEV